MQSLFFIENYPEKCFGDLYFPEDIFDSRTNRHMSTILNMFHEPSLYKSVSNSRIAYRFLYLRSFHGPVSIRLEIDSICKHGIVIMKHCSSEIDQKGFPESLYVQPLSTEQITQACSMMGNRNFWQIPSIETERIFLDGASWLIEAIHNGTYHIADRKSPKDGPVRELGHYFLTLVGLDTIEVY